MGVKLLHIPNGAASGLSTNKRLAALEQELEDLKEGGVPGETEALTQPQKDFLDGLMAGCVDE